MTADDAARGEASTISYLAGGEAARQAVISSVEKMPSDARQVAVAYCVFVSVGGGVVGGFCLPTCAIGDAQWLVVVNGDEPDLETAVAHEVAHAYLRHGCGGPESSREAIEAETRALVRSWGFTGRGADEPS